MDSSRFDTWAKTLTGRLSRRSALKGGGLGLGMATLGAPGLHRLATAQDATPVASPVPAEGAVQEFLFVQTAQAGTWAPKTGEDGVYTLTLTGAAAQTVYFSDRPERIVGTQMTAQFLDALGFMPDNPPNAALVAQTEAGEEVLVIELLNPVYTEDFGPDGDVTLTYDARVLANYEGEGLAFLAARQDDARLPETFGSASLFIDDCADATIECTDEYGVLKGKVKVGCCYHFPSCDECHPNADVCGAVPGCEGGTCFRSDDMCGLW